MVNITTLTGLDVKRLNFSEKNFLKVLTSSAVYVILYMKDEERSESDAEILV